MRVFITKTYFFHRHNREFMRVKARFLDFVGSQNRGCHTPALVVLRFGATDDIGHF
jgi:hypothetical protein